MGKETKTNTGSQGRTSLKKTLILLSMALPGTIWLILLRYIPMGGLVLAFKKYQVNPKHNTFISNIKYSKWYGFENFKFMFATKDALVMIRNTVCYNALWIVLGLIFSIALAVMLNEITTKFLAKTYQTLMFFPYFISWVVVSYFVMALFDPTSGMIVKWEIANTGSAIDWYQNTKPWPVILTVCNLWKNLGYQTILYLAAITGIDKTLYEAASIDGATKWQQIWYVTVPCIRQMIIILLIMNVGKIFNSDFGLFYNVPLHSGTLFPVTQVIDTYVYNVMDNVGMSTAAGLLQNVFGFALIMITNGIVKKIDEESTLF